MNNIEKITINSKMEAKTVLLFVIWLFLVILPFLILSEAIDIVFKESENRLLSKYKIQLIDEVNEFRTNLTTSYYLESKLSNFPESDILKKNDDISLLKQALERHTKSKVAALFYYNSSKDIFESYVAKDLFKDLGMHSRAVMKNLLLTYASMNSNTTQGERSISYFENLLLAAGGINLRPDTSIPILSGKTNLGKMLGYFKTFGLNNNKDQMILCLFKDKDIPLKEVIRNAIDKNYGSIFTREVVSLKDYERIASETDKIVDKRFFKFNYNPDNGLSIFAITSDEMILKLVTNSSFYPINLKEVLANEPVLKVTLPKSALEHPMRETIKLLKFPTILLILLISFGLVRIGIFGYVMDIHILGRVILCVSGAVLLPFASFVVAAYYNQYFSEEYSEYEIEHYTKIQTEVISKAIEAFVGNKELEITKLRERITGLPAEEYHNVLSEWLKDNGASVISYNYGNDKDRDIIKADEKDNLSQLAKEAKDVFNIGIAKAFMKVDLKQVNDYKDMERIYGLLQPNSIAGIVTNIGRIYASIANEPNSLYSLFPIYKKEIIDNKEFVTVVGSVLIKFDTSKLLFELKKSMPELFRTLNTGKYVVRNALIPITEEGVIPSENNMIFSDGFVFNDISQKIKQILLNKTQTHWSINKSINTGAFINQVNAIVISRAEKKENDSGFYSRIDMKSIFIYIVLLVIALSVMLGSIIVSPIRELQKASDRVANGDYTYKIDNKTGDEFETLCETFNEMTDALLQKEKMTSYVSKDVIEEVSNNSVQIMQPSGERIPVSVLFCALSGTKELSQYSPEEVTKIISCLIDAVDEISTAFNGQVDKLIEDTVMVVFRKTSSMENIVLNACRAALAINKRLKVELPDFKIKMGIASGDAVSGKIGSRNGKLDYTVIGNPVNLAARLKVQAGKAKNTGILICPYSIRQLQGIGRLQFIERMAIKGRTNRTFPLYELIGLREI